jgi:hypothetical protein
MAYGLEFRVQDLELRIWGLGFRIFDRDYCYWAKHVGFRVWGLG